MRPIHLFYSWQSDRERKVCGTFIRLALEAAIKMLSEDHGIEVHLDSDTADVPGTPPVSETILGKIRDCEIFVGDVTFVATTQNGKQVPNPNVMIEFGYARGVLTDGQILSVMNTAFGSPKDLPFDLAHLRHPTGYSLDDAASDDVRRRTRTAFAEKLVHRLKVMAEHVLQRRAGVKPPEHLVASARDLLTDVMHMNGRAEIPTVVPGPKVTMQLVSASAADETAVVPARVNAARTKFLPAGYRDSVSDVNIREWANYDPPRVALNRPNPESRWYMRVLRNGAIDGATMIGARIDDDKDILVELDALEARIIEMAERMGAIALSIGGDSSLVIHASLEGMDDVRLMWRDKASRPLRVPFLNLGTITLPSISAITISGLRPIIDNAWLAGGFGDGSQLYDETLSNENQRAKLALPTVVGGRAWR
ncbi:hypothetical protein KX729_23025 [Rhizobium sp. XQZ8]|uniref:hypothetical protein n=1 Tax=Rhizobium populisoli TaxID=2859785 RepID=UPI001CA57680|nr:hypothetical protein [Rhizobium populisoli]MBW6424331.1 hypothetical protein [Rhizobium populisoli]